MVDFCRTSVFPPGFYSLHYVSLMKDQMAKRQMIMYIFRR